VIETFAIQDWLFSSALGRYDIDLAKSGVQFQLVDDLAIGPEWSLDYAPDRGLLEARAAVARQYGGATSSERVAIANGAQEALYLFYRSLLAAGDHVITTVPGWQQSWAVPRHMGCSVSLLSWTPGTPLDVDALETLVGPKTRLVVLTSPGNPSGRRIGGREWSQAVDVADLHGAWILADEEFAVDFRGSVIHRYDRAISVSGLSKTYGMAGLRFGWAAAGSAAGAEIIERMVNYKRYTSISNSVLSERIAIGALAEHRGHVARYSALLEGGRELLDDFASTTQDLVELVSPEGTPFAWFNLKPPISSRASSIDVVERLLEAERVLVMPAEVFGSEGGFRLTYARPRDVLVDGFARLKRSLTTEAAR